jgi:hypothetical protein
MWEVEFQWKTQISQMLFFRCFVYLIVFDVHLLQIQIYCHSANHITHCGAWPEILFFFLYFVNAYLKKNAQSDSCESYSCLYFMSFAVQLCGEPFLEKIGNGSFTLSVE